LGAALGLMADRVLGEPPVPDGLHPVALFGSAASGIERWLYADDKLRGGVYTALNTAIAMGAGAALGSPTAASYLATSGRGLHIAALDVAQALERNDLDEARELLPHLVGRDPAALDEKAIARAVVESVAENTTDAIVAPAFWTVAAGGAGSFLHRAGDTLDSMVGYRNDRYAHFGTAAARLDDVLAWVPARATAGLVALVRPNRASDVWRVVRSDASGHPSPNAGVGEAAFAAALDVQLGGLNHYGGTAEARPVMGDGRQVEVADITAAVDLSKHVSYALAGILAGVGLVSRPWSAGSRERERRRR
jgi:adenosylcobinamide-phosphate synthase